MTNTPSGTNKVRVTLNNSVAEIIVDNPPANTWDLESLNDLTLAITSLNQDPAIVALVISGQGKKFFSAGADLKQFSEGVKAKSKVVAEAFGQAFEALAGFKGVAIAAVNGYAMGGGLEFALACDIRIFESQVIVALPEARVGLLPCAGGTQRLAWLVGEAWASRMILCGEQLDVHQAEKIGLAQEVVATGDALEQARTLAQKVSRQSPDAVFACKRLLTAPREAAISQGLAAERKDFVDLIGRSNQLEGTRAFLEKREPQWQ